MTTQDAENGAQDHGLMPVLSVVCHLFHPS